MAMEPIIIYSNRIDPQGVVKVLRTMAPDLAVLGPDHAWKEASLSLPGPDGRPRKLKFLHDQKYYTGPDFGRQMTGMQGYFADFPEADRRGQVIRLIPTFRFALSTVWDPDLDETGDERLGMLLAVAQHLDGVMFSPSVLHDSHGHILLDREGYGDPQATFPKSLPPAPKAAPKPPPGARPKPKIDTAAPPPLRVARRALTLAIMSARGKLELSDDDVKQREKSRRDLLGMTEALEIGEEVEPDEWAILERRIGGVDPAVAVACTWRVEGLAVLGWALGRLGPPVYDQLAVYADVLDSVGFTDQNLAQSILAKPGLRPTAQLETYRKRIFALHWRLREYKLEPVAMDFEEFARTTKLGPLDLTAFRLVNHDLELCGMPIHEVPEEAVDVVMTMVRERHMAANWLLTGGDAYSKTDTAT